MQLAFNKYIFDLMKHNKLINMKLCAVGNKGDFLILRMLLSPPLKLLCVCV